MGAAEVVTTIFVACENEVNIRRFASDMDIFAADCVDEACKGPHADAPGVALVGRSQNLVVPLPLLLARDAPKVFTAPDQRLARVLVDKFRAHSMRRIVIALEVAVTRAFAGTRSDIRL